MNCHLQLSFLVYMTQTAGESCSDWSTGNTAATLAQREKERRRIQEGKTENFCGGFIFFTPPVWGFFFFCFIEFFQLANIKQMNNWHTFTTSFPSRLGGVDLVLEAGFGVRGGAELDEQLWLAEEEAETDIWLAEVEASWRKILSLRRRFQPSSSVNPPRLECAARSKLNLRWDRAEGRCLAWGFRLTDSASSRLVGLVWSTRRVAGGNRGNSGADRFPCRREGNFLSLKSEPESDHSHSDDPERQKEIRARVT